MTCWTASGNLVIILRESAHRFLVWFHKLKQQDIHLTRRLLTVKWSPNSYRPFIIASGSPLWYQGLSCFNRQDRWKLLREVKLVTRQINDRNKIPDFHSCKLVTGALLTFQYHKPVLVITPTLLIQSFHSGLTYTGVLHENKGIG